MLTKLAYAVLIAVLIWVIVKASTPPTAHP
jgi:hypothetical protein